MEFAAAEEDEAVVEATDRRLRAESIAKLNTMLPSILQVGSESICLFDCLCFCRASHL
jgi:hypothetical protein